MTPIEAIGTLIIRLWAAGTLLMSLYTLLSLYSVTGVIERQVDSSMIYYSLMILLSVLLWVYAHNIASVLTPKTSEHSFKLAVDTTDLVAIGSFLIGFYHLVAQLPAALYQTSILAYKFIQKDSYLFNFDVQIDNLIVQWIVVLVALGLTFRSRDVARMFMRLKSLGPQSEAEASKKDGQEK